MIVLCVSSYMRVIMCVVCTILHIFIEVAFLTEEKHLLKWHAYCWAAALEREQGAEVMTMTID